MNNLLSKRFGIEDLKNPYQNIKDSGKETRKIKRLLRKENFMEC